MVSQTLPSVNLPNYSYNNSIHGGPPPDPQIAVSTTHVLVCAGFVLAFYDKTGNLIQSLSVPNFFASTPLPPNYPGPINKYNDPRAIFDPWRKRFVVGVLASYKDAPIEQFRELFLVAISKSEDPLNGWWLYSWDSVAHWGIANDPVWQPGDINDYPSLGIDSRCLYFTVKVFDKNHNFRYCLVVFRDMNALVNGSVGTGQEFHNLPLPDGSSPEVIQPVIHHSLSTFAYFVSTYGTNNIAIWALRDPLQPAQQMTLKSVTLPNTTFIPPKNAPQAGVSAPGLIRMDNLGNNVLKAVFRDNKLYLVFNDAKDWFHENNPMNSIRLIRLDVSGFPKILTSGSGFINRIFGMNNPIEDTRDTHMYYGWPAVEVNKNHDMAIVYARTGPSIYPQMRYSAYYASEPDIRPSWEVREGQAPYMLPAGVQRWGDTAGASVDPKDDTTIWIAHQFTSLDIDDGNNNYRIWIAKVFSPDSA